MQAVAAALHQLGQLRKARWRVALGGRRLANRQGDLALGHGIARQRIHEQQHMLALVAEMLGHRRGVGRALHAQQRRCVGGRCHHQPIGPAPPRPGCLRRIP